MKQNTYLTCGCCGCGFATWDGYKDQDQDDGYGICVSCQKSAETDADKQYAKMFDIVWGGLSDKAKETHLKMEKDMGKDEARIIVVNRALEKGYLGWEIG